MPFVIDAEELVEKKEKLPTEAFFVDTNTIVYLIDPFGESQSDGLVADLNPKLQRLFNYLKNYHDCYCTVEVAFEYYNHIKFGTMKTQKMLNNNISYRDFKRLRKTDPLFQDVWNKRIKKFKKVFDKSFILRDMPLDTEKLLADFQSENDFIDHVFYHSIIHSERKNWCILTHDADFYTYLGDFYLLTFNREIITSAKNDGKLFCS